LLEVTVNDMPPAISYPRAAYIFAMDVSLRPVVPVSAGGSVVSWAIEPALPGGIQFDGATGQISGRPDALAMASAYLVTATNVTGSDTFPLQIEVRSPVLFDLGHASRIETLQYSRSRILSIDSDRRSVLWNSQNHGRIRTFEPDCDASCGAPAEMAGTTVIVRRKAGFDVYSATDGSLSTRIEWLAAQSSSWKLAMDGSYLAGFDATGILVWSVSGGLLVSAKGDYQNAIAFGTPAELRIANGTAGSDVIETIQVPAGTRAASVPFSGDFHSWYDDGERFFATTPELRVYSSDAALVWTGAGVVQDFAGYDDWIWTGPSQASDQIRFWRIGGSNTFNETLRNQEIRASGSTVALFSTVGAATVVFDLSSPGTVPPRIEYPAIVGSVERLAALSITDWVVGTRFGVVASGLPAGPALPFSHGAVTSIAASPERISFATASGRIVILDAITRELESTIDLSSDKVLLSADGAVLVAKPAVGYQFPAENSVKLYTLPAGNETLSLPTFGSENEIWLSPTGEPFAISRLRRVSSSPSFVTHFVYRKDGTEIWQRQETLNVAPASNSPLRISPSGSRLVTSSAGPSPEAMANFFTSGIATGSAQGWPVGWLDESRLLVNRYLPRIVGQDPGFEECQIVNENGQVLASTSLPELQEFQTIGTDLIYSAALNSIFDVNSGSAVWVSESAHRGPGAANADEVFFASKATVRAEPR
jgi:hypothetical protein